MRYKFLVVKNNQKREDKHPDYRIYDKNEGTEIDWNKCVGVMYQGPKSFTIYLDEEHFDYNFDETVKQWTPPEATESSSEDVPF